MAGIHIKNLCKDVRDAGGILARICPATNNLPTRMTEPSWRSLCKATSAKQVSWSASGYNKKVEQVSNRLNVCRECKGKTLPPGLELITKEEMMATKTTKGVCSACHQRGLVQKAFSAFDPMCTTCAPAFTAVNTRPEVVAQAIIGFGVVNQMLELLRPHLDDQQLIALLGESLPETVQVQCESDALKEIAGVIGYEGTGSIGLIHMVRDLVAYFGEHAVELSRLGVILRDAAKALDDGGPGYHQLPQRITALRESIAVSEDNRALALAMQQVMAALDCECEDGSDSVACVLESIGLLTQTLDKIQQHETELQAALNAELAERYARLCDIERLNAENSRLSSMVEDQADALAMALSGDNLPCTEISSYTMAPEREALADFALRVLAGKVKMEVM